MNQEIIIFNEVHNDGKTIHLYFNAEVGFYLAFGFSAFFASHIVDAITSFSDEMQMPVAILRKTDVEELRMSTIKHQHDYHEYYKLELKNELPLDDYARWAASITK